MVLVLAGVGGSRGGRGRWWWWGWDRDGRGHCTLEIALQYRENLTVSTPASSSSVTFPTMDWTDTFCRKRKWVKWCSDGTSSPGFPWFLTAASSSRCSTCFWAAKEGTLPHPHRSSAALDTQSPPPGLTKGKHLIPVSAEAGPGSGYKAVQPVGHCHGQECRHKHRAHCMNEAFCVRRDFSL